MEEQDLNRRILSALIPSSVKKILPFYLHKKHNVLLFSTYCLCVSAYCKWRRKIEAEKILNGQLEARAEIKCKETDTEGEGKDERKGRTRRTSSKEKVHFFCPQQSTIYFFICFFFFFSLCRKMGKVTFLSLFTHQKGYPLAMRRNS